MRCIIRIGLDANTPQRVKEVLEELKATAKSCTGAEIAPFDGVFGGEFRVSLLKSQ